MRYPNFRNFPCRNFAIPQNPSLSHPALRACNVMQCIRAFFVSTYFASAVLSLPMGPSPIRWNPALGTGQGCVLLILGGGG